MLVLTRKSQELVMIGDDIKVIVLGLNNFQVKLGFEAPRHIDVYRNEIYLRNKANESIPVYPNNAYYTPITQIGWNTNQQCTGRETARTR